MSYNTFKSFSKCTDEFKPKWDNFKNITIKEFHLLFLLKTSKNKHKIFKFVGTLKGLTNPIHSLTKRELRKFLKTKELIKTINVSSLPTSYL